jgi:hypothetical protein
MKQIIPSMKIVTNIPKPPKQPSLKAVEAVCALTDPFCKVAKGVGYPDGNGLVALPTQVRGHFKYDNAGPNGMIFFCPGPNCFLQSDNSGVASYDMGPTWGTAPGSAVFSTYVDTYRIVTAGIIIRNVTAALTANGYIIIRRLGEPPVVNATIPSGNVYGVEVATHPVYAGLEIPIISRPVGTSSRAFGGLNPNTIPPNFDWDTIGIEIVGAPGTVFIDIEVVLNIEFTLNGANTPLMQFITPKSETKPHIVAAASKASEKMSTLVTTGVEHFGAMALNAIRNELAGIAVGFL